MSVCATEPTYITMPDPHQLFEENQGLVEHVLKRYSAIARYARMTKEDVRQLGLMGLWHACQRFDPNLGHRFSTYATHCIWGYMVRQSNDYRFGGHTQAEGRIDHSCIMYCDSRPRRCNDSDDDGTKLIDVVGHTDREAVFDEVARNERIQIIRDRIADLGGRSAEVVPAILGGATSHELAENYGVSFQAISQQWLRSKAKLRESLADIAAEAAA